MIIFIDINMYTLSVIYLHDYDTHICLYAHTSGCVPTGVQCIHVGVQCIPTGVQCIPAGVQCIATGV